MVAYKSSILYKTIKRRFTKNTPIFTAEVYAIIDAINLIKKDKANKATIYSDSRSVLIALKNVKHANSLIQKIQKHFYNLFRTE